jgi:hypothetical protein
MCILCRWSLQYSFFFLALGMSISFVARSRHLKSVPALLRTTGSSIPSCPSPASNLHNPACDSYRRTSISRTIFSRKKCLSGQISMLFDSTFPCYLTTFSEKKCLSGKVICAFFVPLSKFSRTSFWPFACRVEAQLTVLKSDTLKPDKSSKWRLLATDALLLHAVLI